MSTPTTMVDLSTTAASNSPAGSESPTAGDDFLRAIQAILRTTNAKGADIASATTTDIGAATAEFVDVTGTTTITGLGTIAAGIVRTVRFTGALTLTHNATSLILPTSSNITTANGDVAQFRSLGSGNWKCVGYIPQAGYARTGANGDITSLTACTNITAAAVTVATDDKVVIQDTSDSDKLKTVTTQAIANLAAISYLSDAEYITGTETAKALNAAVARANNLVQGSSVASTSGTSIDFTGIPAWAKRITIMFNGVSTNGISPLLIQIGDAGGIENTSYVSAAAVQSNIINTSTAGFIIDSIAPTATNARYGSLVLSLMTGTTWAINGIVHANSQNYCHSCAGIKALSAALTQLRITAVNGTDTFDAGSINIMYE